MGHNAVGASFMLPSLAAHPLFSSPLAPQRLRPHSFCPSTHKVRGQQLQPRRCFNDPGFQSSWILPGLVLITRGLNSLHLYKNRFTGPASAAPQMGKAQRKEDDVPAAYRVEARTHRLVLVLQAASGHVRHDAAWLKAAPPPPCTGTGPGKELPAEAEEALSLAHAQPGSGSAQGFPACTAAAAAAR